MLNNTTKFKVLIHNGIYVNLSMLGNGIYATSIPSLFNFESTIESLIESGKKINTLKYAHHYPNAYFENLNKCELVEFSLIPSDLSLCKDTLLKKYLKHVMESEGSDFTSDDYLKNSSLFSNEEKQLLQYISKILNR
jgi:hypothetical protein